MDETTRERVRFDGPRGRLAGELAYGDGAVRGAAVVLPPHPFMGGHMDTPLVREVAEAAARHGFASLRFDYGGVGASEGPPADVGAAMQQFWDTGTAPDDPVLLEEARAACAWLAGGAGRPLAIIGYSFGAYAAAHCAGQAAAWVFIAPTFARHDLPAPPADLCPPLLIVHGDDDFAADAEAMQRWLARGPASRARVHRLSGGDHFFRGQEAEVAGHCASFLSAEMPRPEGVA